jgi:hypothetical protein
MGKLNDAVKPACQSWRKPKTGAGTEIIRIPQPNGQAMGNQF